MNDYPQQVVLIGGPCDGQRATAHYPGPLSAVKRPKATGYPVHMAKTMEPLEKGIYLPHRFRTGGDTQFSHTREITLYVHEELDVHDALLKLLRRYPDPTDP